MVFDYIIIGNGIFGKLFLYELNKYVKKSQNFSVAHIYSEELAPNCTVRTTSTVSENGIEEGVSALGDDLKNAFHAFVEFVNQENPKGVYPVKQVITATNEKNIGKLNRRYKNNLITVTNSLLNQSLTGKVLDSYIVCPQEFLEFITPVDYNFKKENFSLLATHLENKGDHYQVILQNKASVKAKKVIIATGAFSRINYSFFEQTKFSDAIMNTKVVAGSYLIKKIDLPENIYLNIDGHNIIYRYSTKELIIGSTHVEGAITVPDIEKLKIIFELFQKYMTIDLGSFESFQIETGLRHKGHRRLPSFTPITDDQNVWFFNGAYKNGWSLPFYYLKRDLKNILSVS